MKILFHYPVLNLGGAERSILRLTRCLADRGWHVELVVTTGGGELESAVDPRVRVSHLRSGSAGGRFLEARSILRRLIELPDLLHYLFYRIQELVRSIPYMFRHYDAAVVSLQGLSPRFCCRWVRARRRLHWIRNDLSRCDADSKTARGIRRFNAEIDSYVCVSRGVLESFKLAFPGLSSKATVLYNILDAQAMWDQAALEGNPYRGYPDIPRVLSVCRLSEGPKGLLRMVGIHERLNEEGLNFLWFVVGDGPDRGMLQRAVSEAGLTDKFILLGARRNPYPYLRHADVVAVLSYYEGLSGVVNEAKVLARPLIASRFSGIDEQISHGIGGLIVENDADSIAKALRQILADEAVRARLANDNLAAAILDDDAKITKLESLLR